jgi:hypothetical protein
MAYTMKLQEWHLVLRNYARQCKAQGFTLFGTYEHWKDHHEKELTDEDKRIIKIFYDMDV